MNLRDSEQNLCNPKHMEIALLVTSMTHYIFVHKFIPPDAKAAVHKEWKKLETIPAWDLGKVKSKQGGYSGNAKRKQESPLRFIDGHVSPQKMRS